MGGELFLFPGKEPKLEMLGVFLKIYNFISEEMNIDSQEKGFGKDSTAGSKDKKRNEGNYDLEKIVVKNEIGVKEVCGFKKP
ncbi:MAG: hypothetical protein WC146_02180 [Patescibacteria group bacterium]|jgi:hypothetical protein